MEIMKFIWQNVGIRNEIKLLSAKALLHLHIIVAQSVLASYLIALRKVIDPLEFIQSLVEITFA